MGSVRRQTGCLSFPPNSSFGGLCMKCLLFLQQKRGGVDGILEEIVEERRRGKMSRCWLRVVVDGQPCGHIPDQSRPDLPAPVPRLRSGSIWAGVQQFRDTVSSPFYQTWPPLPGMMPPSILSSTLSCPALKSLRPTLNSPAGVVTCSYGTRPYPTCSTNVRGASDTSWGWH